jgi:hypothetical protein
MGINLMLKGALDLLMYYVCPRPIEQRFDGTDAEKSRLLGFFV